MKLVILLDSDDLRLARLIGRQAKNRFKDRIAFHERQDGGQAAAVIEILEPESVPLLRILDIARGEAGRFGVAVVRTKVEGPLPRTSVLQVLREALILEEVDLRKLEIL
jgi:glutamate formiminotransferase